MQKIAILIEKTPHLVTAGLQMLINNQTVFYSELTKKIYKRNLYEGLIPLLQRINNEARALGVGHDVFIIGKIQTHKYKRELGRIERTNDVRMEEGENDFIRIIIEVRENDTATKPQE